jgi:hypothetical protein
VLLLVVHLLHLLLLLVSSQLTWTATLSHRIMLPLTYCSGGVTTSLPILPYLLWLEIYCLFLFLLCPRSLVSVIQPGSLKTDSGACCLSMWRCSPT